MRRWSLVLVTSFALAVGCSTPLPCQHGGEGGGTEGSSTTAVTTASTVTSSTTASTGSMTCVPTFTSCVQDKDCGPRLDGCGGVLQCGTCKAPGAKCGASNIEPDGIVHLQATPGICGGFCTPYQFEVKAPNPCPSSAPNAHVCGTTDNLPADCMQVAYTNLEGNNLVLFCCQSTYVN